MIQEDNCSVNKMAQLAGEDDVSVTVCRDDDGNDIPRWFVDVYGKQDEPRSFQIRARDKSSLQQRLEAILE